VAEVTFKINADGTGADRTVKGLADRFGKDLSKGQDKARNSGIKLAAAVTAVNQGLEVAKKLVGGVVAVYAKFKKYTIDIADEQARLADNIAKTSRAFGVSADFLQGWASAAGFAGVEASQAERALLNVQKSAFDAARGLSTATDLFARAGVEVKDTNNKLKGADVLLMEIASNLQRGLIPAEEAAAISAQLLRDRTGKMILALQGGPDVIQENIDRLREWGSLMSEELLGLSEEYIDSQQRLAEAKQGLSNTIAEAALPQMTAFNNAMAEATAKSTGLKSAIKGLGSSNGPIDKLGQKVIEISGSLALIPDTVGFTVVAVARMVLDAIARMAGGVSDVLDTLAEKASAVPWLRQYAAGLGVLSRGLSSSSDTLGGVVDRMESMLIQTATSLRQRGSQLADTVDAYNENLAALRAGGAGAGGGAGGPGGGAGDSAGDGPGADIVVPESLVTPLDSADIVVGVDEVTFGVIRLQQALMDVSAAATVASESMVTDFGGITGALGQMSGELATSEDRQESLKKGMKSVAKAAIQSIAQVLSKSIAATATQTATSVAASGTQLAAGTPAAVVETIKERGANIPLALGALAGGVAAMVAIIDGIGDAGIMPDALRKTQGGRRTVMIQGGEAVVDREGSGAITRMLNWWERSVSRGGTFDSAPAAGGTMRVRAPIHIHVGGETIVRDVELEIERGIETGQSIFGRQALAT
jgi:hypothetical protein